jgi:hypothetical protein
MDDLPAAFGPDDNDEVQEPEGDARFLLMVATLTLVEAVALVVWFAW